MKENQGKQDKGNKRVRKVRDLRVRMKGMVGEEDLKVILQFYEKVQESMETITDAVCKGP